MYTEEEIVESLIEAIEDGVGVSHMELESVGVVAHEELFFDRGTIVEADFVTPTFNSDYFSGSRMKLSLEVKPKSATLCAIFGEDCKNPAVANRFMGAYMDHAEWASVWKIPYEAERGCGLVLTTKIQKMNVLAQELKARIGMLNNELFTNELRPFIHYFI